MATNVPDISEAEWKIMKVLWKHSPQPAYDIIQTLAKSEAWQPNTIKTLLGRLHRKKALGVKQYKNLYLYYPLVSQEDCVHAETRSFLDRVFDGSVKPLLVHFVKKQKLTEEDIAELKRLLREDRK
jgi:BlaI family penicillinase repressor